MLTALSIGCHPREGEGLARSNPLKLPEMSGGAGGGGTFPSGLKTTVHLRLNTNLILLSALSRVGEHRFT